MARVYGVNDVLRCICPGFVYGGSSADDHMITGSVHHLIAAIYEIKMRQPPNWQSMIITECTRFHNRGGNVHTIRHIYFTDDSGALTPLYDLSGRI